jgi:hypothetical protein
MMMMMMMLLLLLLLMLNRIVTRVAPFVARNVSELQSALVRLALVASCVSMNALVSGQLVAPGETLLATREVASVRLLASMGANVACLMLQPVEGAIAEWTLIGTWRVQLVYRDRERSFLTVHHLRDQSRS